MAKYPLPFFCRYRRSKIQIDSFKTSVTVFSSRNNIFLYSFFSTGRTGTMVVGANSKMRDNSTGGQVISAGSLNSEASTSVTSDQVDSSPGTIRQTLRDIWANKFDGTSQPSSATITKPPSKGSDSSSNNQSETKKTKCPVCKSEVEESGINEHLDQCLESPPTDKASDGSLTSSNPFVDDDEARSCPVCGKEVLIPEMNHHLDLCIAANQ